MHFSNYDEMLSTTHAVDAFGAAKGTSVAKARALEQSNAQLYAGLTDAVSRLEALGGLVAVAPAEHGPSDWFAPKTGFTVHVTADDVCIPVCGAGDARSQVAALLLRSVKGSVGAPDDAVQAHEFADLCATAGSAGVLATVAPPHGAESGHDPHVAYRDLEDGSGFVKEQMLQAYTHVPLPALERHDDVWLASFGEPKLNRAGYAESIGHAVSAFAPDPRTGAVAAANARPVEEGRTHLHRWFSANVYRRRARYGSRRLIFFVYGRAGEIVARRLVEAAHSASGSTDRRGASCRGIYVVILPYEDHTRCGLTPQARATHGLLSAADAFYQTYGVLGSIVRPAVISSSSARDRSNIVSRGSGGHERLREDRLFQMGIAPRSKVKQALAEAGGDIGEAAAILTESGAEREGREARRELTEMGFGPVGARVALAETGGDVNEAANLLAVTAVESGGSASALDGRSASALARGAAAAPLDRESVASLERMGFATRSARRALVQCHGDVTSAALALAEERSFVERAGLAGNAGILEEMARSTDSAMVRAGFPQSRAAAAAARVSGEVHSAAVLAPSFLDWQARRAQAQLAQRLDSPTSTSPLSMSVPHTAPAGKGGTHRSASAAPSTPQPRRPVRLARSGDKRRAEEVKAERRDVGSTPPRQTTWQRRSTDAAGSFWSALLCCGGCGAAPKPPK